MDFARSAGKFSTTLFEFVPIAILSVPARRNAALHSRLPYVRPVRVNARPHSGGGNGCVDAVHHPHRLSVGPRLPDREHAECAAIHFYNSSGTLVYRRRAPPDDSGRGCAIYTDRRLGYVGNGSRAARGRAEEV